MSERKRDDLEKLTLKEIESRNIRIDYLEYLTDSKPLKNMYFKILSFEIEDSFSIRLSLLLDKNFFDGHEIPSKEREQFIKKILKFPKHRVYTSIDGQEYKVENVIHHSTKNLEVKIVLYRMENVILEELPYRIRWVWADIVDKLTI
jgi:hypothetical protein